jgi:cyanophycinase
MGKAVLRGAMLLVLLGGACGGGRAEESILGLPAPRDPGRPGAVMLHGGGELTTDAFARFVELAGGKQARIVLVPSAGYRRADYDSQEQFLDALARGFAAWVRLATTGRVKTVEFLATDDPADADDPMFVHPLDTATGVWFSGGRQPRLNYRYVGPFPRQTRFQAALRDVVARGVVVGGTSAGMSALPQIMTLYQDRDSAAARPGVVAAHGLGVFDGAIVEQHFDSRSGRLERFTGLLRDAARLDRLAGRSGVGARMLGLAVEGSTALVLQSDRLEVLGAGNAHVFIKSPEDQALTWYTIQAGDKATLRRDARGQTVLATRR